MPDKNTPVVATAHRWLSPAEARLYLGSISAAQFDNLRAAGKIKASYSLGVKSPRYDKRLLDLFMEAGQQNGGQAQTLQPALAGV